MTKTALASVPTGLTVQWLSQIHPHTVMAQTGPDWDGGPQRTVGVPRGHLTQLRIQGGLPGGTGI